MSRRRLAAFEGAVADPAVVAGFRAKVVQVPGPDCLWWTGAISGRGHGRFWYGPGRVVIAHRFAFALAHGVSALATASVLGHRCDNSLCLRIGPGHVVVSSGVAEPAGVGALPDCGRVAAGRSARCAPPPRPGSARPGRPTSGRGGG